KRRRLPTLDDVDELLPEQAIAIIRTSELGLLEGKWPVIGESPSWDRTQWPIPSFIVRDEFSQTAQRVTYAQDNPTSSHQAERIPYETEGREPDCCYGDIATQNYLSELL